MREVGTAGDQGFEVEATTRWLINRTQKRRVGERRELGAKGLYYYYSDISFEDKLCQIG